LFNHKGRVSVSVVVDSSATDLVYDY